MNRLELITQYTRINRKLEAYWMPRVRKALHVKVQGVIDDLRAGGYNRAITNLSMDLGNQELQKVISELYLSVGLRHARLTYQRAQSDIRSNPKGRVRKSATGGLETKGFGFNQQWTNFIINYLSRFLLEKITFEVARTTRDALMKVLTAGTISGLGIDGMIEQLQDWPFERYQAARIIRTEINRASNVGATAQESTSEYEQQKEWMSVEDNRTRGVKPSDHADHRDLNGVVVDSGDEFVDPRNGDRLQFPGDPKASAASVINCRCMVAYTNKRGADGELIPKRKTTTVIYPGQRMPGQIIVI